MTSTPLASRRRSAAAVVLGGIVALCVWVPFRPGQGPADLRTEGASDFIQLPIKPGTPCPDAARTTLAEVQTHAQTPIWLPDSSHLPAMSGAWMCSGTPTFDYGGISFAYEPGWKVDDPAARWGEMVKQWGMGSVETVLGRPAFVLPPSEAAPRGEVLVVVDGTLIRVLGDGKTSIGELEGAVDSIKTLSEAPLPVA